MSSVQPVITHKPRITPGDRFSLTLALAIIAHGIVILGITFSSEDVFKPKYQTMEIILVQKKSNAPEEADYLAQANLEGGGDTEEKISAATPMPAPFPDESADIASPPETAKQPGKVEDEPVKDITQKEQETRKENQEILAVEKEEASQICPVPLLFSRAVSRSPH